MSKYSEKLKDIRWQKKRLEVFDASGWSCVGCLSKTDTLHAHHKKYISAREPWEYDNSEIASLCGNCHNLVHELDRIISSYVNTDRHNASQVVDCALLLKESICDAGGEG